MTHAVDAPPQHEAAAAGALKRVSLALQGGGSHGAFTWGVLEAFLADERIAIEAITGTSAGALNAVVLAEGWREDGRAGARRRLEQFWTAIGNTGGLAPLQRKFFELFFGGFQLPADVAAWWGDLVTHYASPYQFNPLNLNPLRDLLVETVDFAKVRAQTDIKLFVAATNVHNGKIRIFEASELQPEHVLASACLPFLFQAVEIDGVPYWDGGYMGNPAIFPLFYKTSCPDIVIVQINPIERKATPRSVREIQDRLNEITFNGALLRELRVIEFVSRLVDAGKLSKTEYMRPFIHRIDGGEMLGAFSASSKLNTSWSTIEALREAGRATATAWLVANFDALGRQGTLDLRTVLADG
jgi:NTE family protein